MAEIPNHAAYLESLSARVQSAFKENRTILSFSEWFELLMQNPRQNLRNAAQYTKDTFDHFGQYERPLATGHVRRFRLFDAEWANGVGSVAGHEQVQEEIYHRIDNFIRYGQISRLIVLHGPNGSAKSSIVQCLQNAMEQYSRTQAGALYSYSWIFPSEKIVKGKLGFGGAGKTSASSDSYAKLSVEQIDARLPCELRDHPIFFIPKAERAQLFEKLRAEGRLPADFVLSRYITTGDLSPKDRAIYHALLLAYDGDHAEVMRHVQVERFFISRKYASALATIEPQMHVDADARQITADHSIANLPRSLQTVPLFELRGPLVSANRGLLEFADLLKRPLEAFKYLLTTSEQATASLTVFSINLDELMIASTNENQLEAFREHPEWNSFRGRMDLITVPYLRRLSDEIRIYDHELQKTSIDRPLAPHVVEVIAMWAVLTRLRQPTAEHYPSNLRDIIAELKPIEKLWLYENGSMPKWCTAIQARELGSALGALYDEYRNDPFYEGKFGASAREIRTLLFNAAHRSEHSAVTPLAIFDELREFIKTSALYDFLQQKPQSQYHDHEEFIRTVENWWLDLLDRELRTSMGLVEDTLHEELFTRYVLHVSHLLKKAKLFDKTTAAFVDPDQDLLRDVETTLLAKHEDSDDFRRSIISRIGAWSVDHSGMTPDYRQLFPHYIAKLEEDYYLRQRRVIAKNLEDLLRASHDGRAQLDADAIEKSDTTLRLMRERFGYAPEATTECASYLLKMRYLNV